MSRKFMFLLAITAITMAFYGCFSIGTLRGDGRMTDGSFGLNGPVNKIEFDGIPGTINLSSEKSDAVTYRIHNNLVDLLDIEFENGVLIIGVKNNRVVIGDGIEFNIGTDALESIVISSGATLKGDGTFTADKFSVKINGAVTGQLDLDVSETSVVLNGAADLTLTGETHKLTLEINGASNVNTRELAARDAKVTINGTGSVHVHADDMLDIFMAGAGSVRYWGDPHVSQTINGIGFVRKGD